MFTVTEGIVLKRIKVSDYDIILNVFTKKYGKISLSIKGARSVKSKLSAGSQPFVYGEFAINKSGKISKTNSIDIYNSFYDIRTDLDKLSVGCYILELISVVTNEDVNIRLFDFVIETLSYLEKTDNIHLVKIIFELKLLNLIGLKPELEHCVNCGNQVINPKFSVENGGVICSKCYELFPNDYKLGKKIPKLMAFIISENYDILLSSNINEAFIKKIDYINKKFLLFHLEKKDFKSLKFYT